MRSAPWKARRSTGKQSERRSVAWGCAGRANGCECRPLDGGVSSEIWRVELPGRRLCLKRALPRLGSRSSGRRRSSATATRPPGSASPGGSCPDAVPQLLGRRARTALFAMEYLDRRCLSGVEDSCCATAQADPAFAAAGRRARSRAIHAATAGDAEIAARFRDRRQLLRAPPRALPDRDRPRASRPRAAARRARRSSPADTRRALVHGDVSPKNILVGRAGRCSSTPNAPGTATRHSTSPSASITCC